MAAFLRRISIPTLQTAAEDAATGSSDDGNDKNDYLDVSNGLDRPVSGSTFCYHAIAVGNAVVGNLSSENDDNDGDTSSGWRTNFDAPILTVTSNTSGSIIACATASHVSLLKGFDGSIIATRQITQCDDDLIYASPGLVFVNKQDCGVMDVLAVVCPVHTGEWDKNNVIIISNIDGEALNSTDPEKFREGATSLSIDILCLDNNNQVGDCIAANVIDGVFMNVDTIRFFHGKMSGTISAFDYNITSKEIAFVTGNLFQQIGMDAWKYEEQVGLSIDNNSSIGIYLVLAASHTNMETRIGWINVLDLTISSNHPIAADEKLVSLKPLRSNHPDECVAISYATKSAKARKNKDCPPKIFILQSLLGRTKCGNQILFTIQPDSNARTVEICSPPASSLSAAYSFRYATMFDGTIPNMYNEFVPNDQGKVGTVHYLLESNYDFDGAHRIINDEVENRSNMDGSISTPIHKSLIWLWKLRHILSTKMHQCEEYQQILRQLTFGAAAGDDRFIENMIAASEFVLYWPNEGNNSCYAESSSARALLRDVHSVLSIFCSEMEKIVDVLCSSPKRANLQDQNRRLYNRLKAIEGLKSILASDANQINLNDVYLRVGSIDELLNILVSQTAFKSAEHLQKSEHGKSLTPDSISAAALCIPHQSDSKRFLPWLCDLVIPSLHVGHPKLDFIRAWTCKVADLYDEEGLFGGIESSISLLKAVSSATAKLSVRMNTFSALHGKDLYNEPCSASMHHRPSVLRVGIIRGRKVRQGRTFSAKRGGAVLDSATIQTPSCDLGDIDDIEHDCVEEKLIEAARLKRARDLGMDKGCLTLSNYKRKGDHFVVKELVKSALLQTTLDQSSSALAVSSIKQFAEDVNVDFDHEVRQFSIELSHIMKDDITQYLIATDRLAQWCDSPSVMCLIVLSMLQKALVSIQRPPDLSKTARLAIESSTDASIKSELEEAARLLSIDNLVRKYCGNGAQEYFRVSNTMHGIQLVHHVCRHVDVSSVLSDVLILCDAFKDIPVVNVCISLLERVMISSGRNRIAQCAHIMSTLYSRDVLLAESVGERAVSFCMEVLQDCKRLITGEKFAVEAKVKAKQIVRISCSILTVMVNEAKMKRNTQVDYIDILQKLNQFEVISKLQSDCDIYLTLSELEDPSSIVSVVIKLLSPAVALSIESLTTSGLLMDFKPVVRNAKNWCAVLCKSPIMENVWSYSIGKIATQIATTSGRNATILLEVSGAFEGVGSGSFFQSTVAVALTLCNGAISKTSELPALVFPQDDLLADVLTTMMNMLHASQLLNKHAILSSPPDALPSVLTLSTLLELVCDVFARSDLGVGEALEAEMAVLNQSFHKPISFCKKVLPPSPILHTTWYVGDGLLIQPLEALTGCASYCQSISCLESVGISFQTEQTIRIPEIISMLEVNGALNTTLRLLAHGNALSLSKTSSNLFNSDIVANCISLSAERSLGGTESGLTSGSIDSLLSVSFLLHLSKESAFKVFQASLPSAIGNRNCTRILAIAGIGSYLGIGKFSCGAHFPWRKQQRFIDQCEDLFRNAVWWNVFSCYDIAFDPSVFSDITDSASTSTIQSYCEQLVERAANNLGPKYALRLGRKYASTFGLEKYCPVSALVTFLLSPLITSDIMSTNSVSDIRWNLTRTEDEARSVLLCMPVLNQVKVLRKCVINMEKSDYSDKDYDRQAMVISLYHESLAKLSDCIKKSDARKRAHDEEMGQIERRQDALVLLSSVFDKFSYSERPSYVKMFEPLPKDPSVPTHNYKLRVGVLGSFVSCNSFDSLLPLHDVLEKMRCTEVLGVLDTSLCPLLLLPTGYIHARSLILRLTKLLSIGEDLPSFEDAVVPVVKKLANADDRADFAWWISQLYPLGSNNQLKCLDLAYINATLASDAVELFGDRSDDERAALDRVQKIDSARAGLSDKVLVAEVLSRHQMKARVKSLYNEILTVAYKAMNEHGKYSPELLVRELLIQGSEIAAVSALKEQNNLSISDFRSLALIIHDACQSLANRYSHLSVGKIARQLMRQWLVEGDEAKIIFEVEGMSNSDCSVMNECEALNTSTKHVDIEDDSDFVIDMKIFDSRELSWTIGSNTSSRLSTVEEQSSIKPLSSNEICDQMNSRAALRIAFATCLVKDFHRQNDSSSEDDDENTENNICFNKSILKAKKHRAGLFEGDLAMYHAQELLQIVFAKGGNKMSSSCRALFDESISFNGNNSILSTIQEEHSFIKENANKSRSFSFAMRHRAMRVASILCPHDLVLRVMEEEGFVSTINDNTINTYMFATFVAMEIEAMGLPLPHSDLVKLSSMNYSSYARTIWRHHGGISSRGLSGRLYLLLLNLCVNNPTSIDWELFASIFSELKRLELPRSLLLACEYVVQSRALELAASEQRADILTCVSDAVDFISSVIINNLGMDAGPEFCVEEILSTLHRLVSLIIADPVSVDHKRIFNEYMTLASHLESYRRELSQGVCKEAGRISEHLPLHFH